MHARRLLKLQHWLPPRCSTTVLSRAPAWRKRRRRTCMHHDCVRTCTTHSSSSSKGPLDGVRVLDLTRVVAGPYCSMTLADMGADVIKVEQPVKGDETRSWGPPFVGEETTYFFSVNRNKRSITVDLKTAGGAALVRQLATRCDVLVENFVPGKLARMAPTLTYEALADLHPGLVWCSLTGWGADGPDAHRTAYDVAIAAVGGLLSITGERDGPPVKPGVALIDVITGLQAHGAILAALLERTRTGVGQRVDCSLLESQIASLINVASAALNAGQEPARWGSAHASIVPYQVFKFADGDAVVAALNDGQFRILCNTLDIPEVADDARYATNAQRVANRDSLIPMFASMFASCSRSDVIPLLAAAGAPASLVNTVPQALQEPQVLHRRMVQQVQHSTVGPIKLPGVPVKFSGHPSADCIRMAPPTLGQHTTEVCREVLAEPPRAGASSGSDWFDDIESALEQAREEGCIGSEDDVLKGR